MHDTTLVRAAHPRISIPSLRHVLSGRVIGPEDDGYDHARAVFFGGFDQRPAVIIRPTDATEVAQVVALARETGLELAVRSGGHSSAGHGTTQGGILLDLSAMKALDIDPARRTAWAQTGLTAGEYTTAAAAHELATGFGDTASVGLGGITLGGGIGYLVRKHGLTVDSLLAAELVTADGRLVHTDPDHHPELFWALRGGGGNFGVATRLKFRLHPLGGIVGGMLLLPATAQVIADFMAAAEAAPEELSTIANVMPAPPMPFVPPDQRGRLVIMAMLCWAGDAGAGQRALARSGPWPSRSPMWSSPCRTRACSRPSAATGTRTWWAAPCSSTGSTPAWPKRSSATCRRRTRPCGQPSCGCSAGPWLGCRSRRPHSPTATAGSW
jgi:hypothetical protein